MKKINNSFGDECKNMNELKKLLNDERPMDIVECIYKKIKKERTNNKMISSEHIVKTCLQFLNEKREWYIEKMPIVYFYVMNKLISLKINYNKIPVSEEGLGYYKKYPHINPDNVYLPYKETVNVLGMCCVLFEEYSRSEIPVILENFDKEGSLISTNESTDNYTDIYHSDRYMHYFNFLLEDDEYIIFPSSEPFGFNDLIYFRAYPIGLVGINTHPSFVDGYMNAPMDFFVHDINHTRRFISFNRLCKEINQYDSYKKMYENFSKYISKNVLPVIRDFAVKNKDIDNTNDNPLFKNQNDFKKSLKDLVKKYRWDIIKIARLIFFEILHEYALPPDKYFINKAFASDPVVKIAPFEIMSDYNNVFLTKKDIDILKKENRLENQNIKSGNYENIKKGDAKLGYNVNYIWDTEPHFLASAFNKTYNRFYDNPSTRYSIMPLYNKNDRFYRTENKGLLIELFSITGLLLARHLDLDDVKNKDIKFFRDRVDIDVNFLEKYGNNYQGMKT